MEDQETLLQFPCDFPLKIMGEARADFTGAIAAIVRQHAPDFDAGQVETRASSGGKYISLTCTVTATSKGQLDDLYRALTSHPWVKVVL